MVISASLQACGVVFPFAMLTSICRSIVTICSGLYLLIGMTRFSSKWILSHSTWYKFRRSGQAQALHRGRCMKAVACIEWNGVPVDVAMLDRLKKNIPAVRRNLIRQVEAEQNFGIYTFDKKDNPHFSKVRSEEHTSELQSRQYL